MVHFVKKHTFLMLVGPRQRQTPAAQGSGTM